MDAREFLNKKGIDIGTVSLCHYPNNPNDYEVLALDELMEDFAQMKCKEQKEICADLIDFPGDIEQGDEIYYKNVIKGARLATDQ